MRCPRCDSEVGQVRIEDTAIAERTVIVAFLQNCEEKARRISQEYFDSGDIGAAATLWAEAGTLRMLASVIEQGGHLSGDFVEQVSFTRLLALHYCGVGKDEKGSRSR